MYTTSAFPLTNVTEATFQTSDSPVRDPLTSEKSTELAAATMALNTFMPWLLIVIGSVCNFLVILGMRTRNFRSLSTSVYMMVGSVNDLMSLNILLVAHWLYVNFPESIARGDGADVMCKFFNFYGWVQADFGIMLMAAMTADRAHAIVRPMTTLDLVKLAKIVTAVCVVVVSVKDFHFSFTSVIVDKDRQDRVCDVQYLNDSYQDFYDDYWPWIDMIFDTLCFVVLAVSNLIIIRHLHKSRRGSQLQTRDDIPGSAPTALSRSPSTMTIHSQNNSNVTRQVTRMLLAESIIFILLSFPFSVHLMVSSQLRLYNDTAKAKSNQLAFSVVFYLLYANKCVNFFVYCLAGKRFRQAIVAEVLCRFKCGTFQFGEARRRNLESDSTQRTRSQRQRVEDGQQGQEMLNSTVSTIPSTAGGAAQT